MRVAFVTNMYPTAGRPSFGIMVERLRQALTDCGATVDVVPVAGDRGAKDYMLGRPRVQREIRRIRPDVVHVHFGYTTVVTSGTAPRVVTFYGDDLNGESRGDGTITVKSRIGIELSQWAARRCDASIAVSESLRLRIRDMNARERCVVIPDAVDTRLFSPGDRDVARRRAGAPEGGPLILFPYSPTYRTKRIDLASAAVRALSRRGVDATLWVVHDRRPEDMPDIYRAADVLLITSDTEGGPTAVKEALACGTPVVSVPVGDLEVLRDAGAAARIAERNPDALADALAAMLALPSRGISRLPAARTLAAAARRVLAVYENARARHAGAVRTRVEVAC